MGVKRRVPFIDQLCNFRIGNLLTWGRWTRYVWTQNRPYLVPLLKWTLSLLGSSDITFALAFSILLLLLFAKTRPFVITNAFLQRVGSSRTAIFLLDVLSTLGNGGCPVPIFEWKFMITTFTLNGAVCTV